MAKSVNDAVLDAALNYVKTNCAQICVCSSEPTTYAAATTTYKLAAGALTSANFGSTADGDTSGRKIAVPAKADISITATGTATHIALVSGSILLYVTTCTSQSLTSGNTVTVPTWDIEIADPS